MEAAGLEPAGPGGGWQQPFEIIGITGKAPTTWRLARDRANLDLTYWDDFIAVSGLQEPVAEVAGAEMVFVGYGITAPEFDWDDFKGADLRGKVLLMLNNDPEWDPKLFEGERRLYYGRWDYKYESAARQGAAGAIIIHTTPSAGYPWQVVQTSWSGEQFELPDEGLAPHVPVKGWVTEAAAKKVASLGGKELGALVRAARKRDFRPVPLGITTSLRIDNVLTRSETANVLGLLRGADPVLAQEVVVYTAHHDHLGIGEPDSAGDRIYNGALDNASGVATILSHARAFEALPQRPRRSILFLAVGVEESGLLGSEYYAGHPTFPHGRIAANLNFDGANIWGRTEDITINGYGKSSLDTVLDAAAAMQGRVVVGDQFPDRGFYYRSDQFNFAKIGVPALSFDSGLRFVGKPAGWGRQQIEAWEAVSYHQPSDELEPSWDLAGLVEDARLGFITGVAIANADAMPDWKPGDEFEAARKAALGSLGAAGR